MHTEDSSKGFSLEVKVGLLLLVALLLAGGFLVVLGRVSLARGYPLYVDFDNPGGIKPGAAVRVAGVRVGTVEESRYLGGRLDPATGRRPLVRLELEMEDDVRDTIHTDALFYVSSSGVLGEPFLAIDPGDPEKPPLAAGSVREGIDPPRLDLALAMGFELLETLVGGVRNNREEIAALLHDTSGLVRALNQLVGNNREKLASIVANLEAATSEGRALLAGARESYVDGAQIRRIRDNLDRTLREAGSHAGPLLTELRGALGDARDVLGPEQRAQLKQTLGDVAVLAERGKTAAGDAQQLMSRLRNGEGTVGALLVDEEIYDDVQELLRDLKHNPWKLFWRE